MEKLQRLRSDGLDLEKLSKLCEEDLRALDDDWVLAGIELGLVRNCVVFGVHDRYGPNLPAENYVDHFGNNHLIGILSRLDGELGYQGKLSDMAYRDRYSPIWDILRWKYSTDNHVFDFERGGDPLWVDIDLDAFAINWTDYTLPWNDQIFASELLHRSDYSTTRGWSPKEFILGLLDLAGLFTIATEPRHCGGIQNVLQILERLNHYVFDDSLDFPRLEDDES